MFALALSVAVTIVCTASLLYSIKLLMFFRGGVLSHIWVGVFFASAFLLFCSLGTTLGVLEGEENFIEIGSNLGIAIALFYAGFRSHRFWTRCKPS